MRWTRTGWVSGVCAGRGHRVLFYDRDRGRDLHNPVRNRGRDPGTGLSPCPCLGLGGDLGHHARSPCRSRGLASGGAGHPGTSRSPCSPRGPPTSSLNDPLSGRTF
eukprot:scaffold292832_cov31-Tisochrysis_lutea.AAC.2